MNCSNCGSSIPDNAASCPVCGQPVQAGNVSQNYQQNQMNPQGQPMYGNYGYPSEPAPSWSRGLFLALSILEIIFTGILFGVLAMVWTNKANTAYVAGDYTTFRKHKKTATIFLVIGLVLGIIGIIARFFLSTSTY